VSDSAVQGKLSDGVELTTLIRSGVGDDMLVRRG